MGAIQFTDRGTAVRARQETRTLTQAAIAALPAPSIFNSQPWRWRISADGAELRADRARQLSSVDPDGRMLTVSCGIALHHALTALAAKGALVTVDRLPDPGDPDLLAMLRITGSQRPDPAALRLAEVMAVRRTDRRPFSDRPVPQDQLELLRAAAEAGGAHLHLLRPDEVIDLTAVAGRAATVEINDPAYRADLERWTHRDQAAGDGIGAVLAAGDVEPIARPVPLRDFTGTGEAPTGMPSLADRAARYAVLFTDCDGPADWLAAGAALSSVLLTAAGLGLASSPMSDLVEVPFARWRLRQLLSGIGHPVIVTRFGVPADQRQAPATPRRPATDIIELVEAAAQARTTVG
mgnify:CR=1 FL=1